MEKTTWKILAIIFAALFIIETSIFIWGAVTVANENEKIEKCYYDICSEYPEALVEGNVCFCYEYSYLDQLIVAKTEIIK